MCLLDCCCPIVHVSLVFYLGFMRYKQHRSINIVVLILQCSAFKALLQSGNVCHVYYFQRMCETRMEKLTKLQEVQYLYTRERLAVASCLVGAGVESGMRLSWPSKHWLLGRSFDPVTPTCFIETLKFC